jgi:hypothetical protein
MLDPSGEGRREGLRIRNPGSNTAAPVRLVADLDTIHTDRAFSRVEPGGVLEAPEAALVHLLGNPAFVPDVRVTAALVERGEYALHLGRPVARDGQPGAFRVVLVEVCRGVFDADLRQAGTSRLEGHKSHVSLELDGVIGAAAGLHALPRRTSVVAPPHLRAIHVLWLFLAVAYLAMFSIAAKRGKGVATLGVK